MGQPLYMTADERPTTIQEGFRAIWFEETQLIAFVTADCRKTYRTSPQYDDKFPASFLRSAGDVAEFVTLLATTHGLKVKREEDSGEGRLVFSFITP